VPLIVALLVIVGLIFVFWIAVGHENGPSASDTAISYALARARGEWSIAYDLSSKELRGGLNRAQFVAAQRGSYAPGASIASPHVQVEQATALSDAAVVVVRVEDLDLALRVDCERREGSWVVTAVAEA
jgi:hypothetical protein